MSVAVVALMIAGLGPVRVPSALGSPRAVILGDSTIESTADASPLGMVEANQFIASASGTVTSLSIYLDGANAATNIGLALYSDASGVPGTLLAQGSRSSVQNGAWNGVTIPATALTSGTRLARAARASGRRPRHTRRPRGGEPRPHRLAPGDELPRYLQPRRELAAPHVGVRELRLTRCENALVERTIGPSTAEPWAGGSSPRSTIHDAERRGGTTGG